jgi:cell wall-associated NlpC family hydrolase
MHWAHELIGEPWEQGRDGPHSFDCWGLVRYVFREHHHVALPVLELGTHNNEASIRELVKNTPWSRVESAPADRDVVLCRGAQGRHVGTMVEADHRLGLLHCFGSPESPGSVVWEDLGAARARGFWGFEFWRHSAS